jgi:hypothetical protein
MTRNDIIRMARQAGFGDGLVDFVGLQIFQRFAALVADAEAKRIYEEGMVTIGHMREQILAEREACAKVCDEVHAEYDGEEVSASWIATAIRTRSK